MIDIDEHITAIDRRVGTRTLEAGEARVVTIGRTFNAGVDDVWDACTNPERIPRWFLPVTGDLRVGGSYALEGNASGTVERCDPPTSFAATWEFGDEISWIEISLAPTGGGTRLTLEHIAHVDDERWAQFGPGAVGVGWDLGLIGLALHLQSGESVDPVEVMTWSASEDGRSFIARSSDGWREASVAAGTDPDAARRAAERTTAFYTGAEAEPEADPAAAG